MHSNNCVIQSRPSTNPCYASVINSFFMRWETNSSRNINSMILKIADVRRTGLQLPGSVFFPFFLKIAVIIALLQLPWAPSFGDFLNRINSGLQMAFYSSQRKWGCHLSCPGDSFGFNPSRFSFTKFGVMSNVVRTSPKSYVGGIGIVWRSSCVKNTSKETIQYLCLVCGWSCNGFILSF